MRSLLSTKKLIPALVLLAFVLQTGESFGQRKSSLRSSNRIMAAFRPVVAEASESTVRILSDDKEVCYGTIVDPNGWILTKASELGEEPKVKLKNGKVYDAEHIGEHERHDIAMLKIKAKDLKAVTWRPSREMQPGDWVATAGISRDPVAIGVVSVAARKLPNFPLPGARPGGYLGVYLSEDDNGLKVSDVTKDSGADKGGIKANDTILEVDGKEMNDRNDLLGLLSRRKPGQKVRVKIRRGDEDIVKEITLGKRPRSAMSRGDFQNRMGSELSNRRTGFSDILQHDTVVKPSDCGGPLVDLDGKVVGINIARAGRTESYAIPSDIILPLILDFKAGKLTKKEGE